MRRRGRIDSVTAAVTDLAGALRRARESRAPRVRLHLSDGDLRELDVDSGAGALLLATAEALLEAAPPRQDSANGA